jgi:hypothetical protein
MLNSAKSVKQNGAPKPPPHSATPIAVPPQKLGLPPNTDNQEVKRKDFADLPKYPKIKLNGYVGFASLPYQVVRSQQRG